MMKKTSAMLLLLAVAVSMPNTAQATRFGAGAAKPVKPPKPERAQQRAFLKAQLAAAKATVKRGKPVLKAAKKDATAAAKRELALRKPRLATKTRWDQANLAYRSDPSPANKARLDAASDAHLPNKQAHETALAAKAAADARLSQVRTMQTRALLSKGFASLEKKQGPSLGLRARVAQWAVVRSGRTDVTTVSSAGVIYSRLPPITQPTNAFNGAGAGGNPPPFSLPPPPAGARQYDVVPFLLPAGGLPPPPVPPRPLRQNVYEQPNSQLGN